MQDGSTIRNGYPLDLDNVSQGCRIGMMRCSDGTLHYYYNGSDQGVACGNIPPGRNRKLNKQSTPQALYNSIA